MIGAFSDKCTSRFGKRRPFIVVSGLLTCFSMIGVAYAREIAQSIALLQYGDEDMEIIRQTVTYYYFINTRRLFQK